MAIVLTVNGIGFTYPETDDVNWGEGATNWAAAITTGTLQKDGTNFTLTAEADFGPDFGIVSIYFKSRTANAASGGVLRLAHTDTINWRNAGNTADLVLGVNGSNNLTFEGNEIVTVNGPFGGLVTGASNLGVGEVVFAQETSNVLEFKSLIGGSNINLSSTANEVTIDATGEANTSSNAGAGEGFALPKSGVDLPFKSLVGQFGIDVSSDADEVFVDVNKDELFDISINAQTGTSYTLVLSDAHKLITLDNTGFITLTVPSNASVPFTIGTIVNIAQKNTGQVLIAEGSGVTVNTPETLNLADQWSVASLIKIGTDEWILTGRLEAA